MRGFFVPSIHAALLRRLGMRKKAHLREAELFRGEWGDELVFAVLDHEWGRDGPAVDEPI
jgi:RimJ/RimL family protein N-acetyltransferase